MSARSGIRGIKTEKDKIIKRDIETPKNGVINIRRVYGRD